jgi:hypothetical protein
MEDLAKELAIKERRRAPRTYLNNAFINVYSQKIDDNIDFKAKVCDISSLGIRFVSHKPYIQDSKLNIALISPTNSIVMGVTGRVVRSEQRSTHEYHVALEFKVDPKQQSSIEDYIKMMKMREME